jgi:hypothetical protein
MVLAGSVMPMHGQDALGLLAVVLLQFTANKQVEFLIRST